MLLLERDVPLLERALLLLLRLRVVPLDERDVPLLERVLLLLRLRAVPPVVRDALVLERAGALLLRAVFDLDLADVLRLRDADDVLRLLEPDFFGVAIASSPFSVTARGYPTLAAISQSRSG